MATKKKNPPAGDFITSPVPLPAINFNVSITPVITPHHKIEEHDGKYLWFAYEIRINGSQPCTPVEAFICPNGELPIEEIKKAIGENVEYITQHAEAVTLYTMEDLVQESYVAVSSDADIKEKLAGVMQFVLDVSGTTFKAPEWKSYLHMQLSDKASEMVHRVQGGRSYSPVENKKKRDSFPPLNPRQLRWLDHDYDEALINKFKKARKAPEALRRSILGRLVDEDTIKALEERKSTIDHAHKYTPSQVALIHAAKRAGVKNVTMEKWSTLKGQLDELRKRTDKDVIFYRDEPNEKTPILLRKKRTKT